MPKQCFSCRKHLKTCGQTRKHIVSGNIVTSLGFLTLLNCTESTDIILKITTRQCGKTTECAFRIAHDRMQSAAKNGLR